MSLEQRVNEGVSLRSRRSWNESYLPKGFSGAPLCSALVGRYMESGVSQVVGCECALQYETSFTHLLRFVHSVPQHKSCIHISLMNSLWAPETTAFAHML